MAFLIDTNVAIRLRDGDTDAIERIAALDDAILMSIVTRVELEGGVYREPRLAAIRRARLDVVFAAIPALTFDQDAADQYRLIISQAGYSRRKILDRMIAAQALSHRAKLVTYNGADFSDVPGLEFRDWSAAE